MTTNPQESIAALWAELKEHLEARFRELNDEIRHYPTPIARCDDQLTKLIEQRDHARAKLERADAADPARSSSAVPLSIGTLDGFLSDDPSDETEFEIRSRLRAVLLAKN